jgi:hypothetical protein
LNSAAPAPDGDSLEAEQGVYAWKNHPRFFDDVAHLLMKAVVFSLRFSHPSTVEPTACAINSAHLKLANTLAALLTDLNANRRCLRTIATRSLKLLKLQRG